MASQQAPVRPRFSIASLPAPAPPSNQVPQTRPPFTRPPFHQNFRLPIARPLQPAPPPAAVAPQPPAPPATAAPAAVLPVISSYSSAPQSLKPRVSAPNSPLPTPQVPKLISSSPTPPPPSPFQASLAVATTITAPALATTPTSFSKINKSQPNNPSQSPKTGPISPPTLPLPQINYSNAKRESNKDSDSKHFGAKVVTLAGDNKGAIMEFGPSMKKGNSIAISSNEEEINSKSRVALVNSNVQGVNNSILYNSYVTQHNPGVHLSVYGKANGNINE